MTTTALTAIPAQIIAGDTCAVTLTFGDYPAPTWGLTWSLAGASALSVTSTASSTDHALALTAIQTAALSAGSYQWRVRASDGTTVNTVASGILTVTPDVGALAAGEGLSWEETTLPIVEAALSGTIEGEMRSYMIGGRRVDTFSLKELLTLRDDLKSRVDALRGLGFGAPVRFSFRPVGA